MKVLITGGTGTVGREAVKRLVAHGHDVLVVGRREGLAIEGAEYRSCDINDFDAVREVVRGREGVVHLAAIPHPSGGPGQEVFRVNALGTYNVFEAAAQEGIRRIVAASSINAFGLFMGVVPFDVQYLPIDEEHDTYTTDSYSFSKQIIEEIARYYWRRDGISSILMRLPGVYEIGGPDMGRRMGRGQAMRDRLEQVLAMPVDERQELVDALIRETDEVLRPQRLVEQPRDRSTPPRHLRLGDVGLVMMRNNFWANIDARDSAQAIELGLTVDYTGSHVLFINDDRNSTGLDSKLLADAFFAGVPWHHEPVGDESLVSIERARELLGFQPKFHSGDRMSR